MRDIEHVLPAALAARPYDERRKLPIPKVNETPEGGHDFTAINGNLNLEAGVDRLCGLCWEPLTYWIAFMGGESSNRNRLHSDPPMHEECATAALTLCPHIARPHMKRAPDHRLRDDVVTPPGMTDERQDAWYMGITRDYKMEMRQGFLYYLPKPWKRTRVFRYDDNGTLKEVT